MTKIIPVLAMVLMSLAAKGQSTTLPEDIRGKSCNGGLGFCPDPSISGRSSNNNQGTMKQIKVIKVTGNIIVIEIEIMNLTIEEQILIFGKEFSDLQEYTELTFVQNDDYEFQKDMLLYLEINPKFYLLKKGNYPLEVIDDKILVTLTLSES